MRRWLWLASNNIIKYFDTHTHTTTERRSVLMNVLKRKCECNNFVDVQSDERFEIGVEWLQCKTSEISSSTLLRGWIRVFKILIPQKLHCYEFHHHHRQTHGRNDETHTFVLASNIYTAHNPSIQLLSVSRAGWYRAGARHWLSEWLWLWARLVYGETHS